MVPNTGSLDCRSAGALGQKLTHFTLVAERQDLWGHRLLPFFFLVVEAQTIRVTVNLIFSVTKGYQNAAR